MPFSSWIKEPSSWISLCGAIASVAAAASSGTTLFLLLTKPGELELILPDRVGIKYTPPDEQAEMLLPLTLANTGAASTRRYIVSVTASLSFPQPPPEGGKDPIFVWEYEKTFIGWREWFRKHPEENPGAEGYVFEDYVDYVGRAFAFPLAGESSNSKVLHMLQSEGKLYGRKFDDFTLSVRVWEPQASVEAKERYACGYESSGEFVWCRRVGSQR
jgi:hypothetical protein